MAKTDKWLTYYFASNGSNVKLFDQCGVMADSLISFATFARNPQALPADIMKRWASAGTKFMLDSGAFTNFQKPGTIKLEQYRDYLKSEGKAWTEYVTLDDLGSRENTLKQHDVLRKEGLSPLFVDHIRFKDHPEVDRIWKADPKVAMSSWGKVVNPSGPQPKIEQDIKQAMKARTELARKVDTKVHMLGVSSLKRFLPHLDIIDSVDSFAYSRARGFGRVMICVERDIGGHKLPFIELYDHPRNLKPVRPAPPEVKAMVKAFLAKHMKRTGRAFSTILDVFCATQLQKYVDKLNSLTPHEIMEAASRHTKDVQKTQEVDRRYVFLSADLPEEIDQRADAMPTAPTDSDDPWVIEASQDFTDRLVAEQVIKCACDVAGCEVPLWTDDEILGDLAEVVTKAISDDVDLKEWQALREALVGTWKGNEEENVAKLRKFLGQLSKATGRRLRIVQNYLVGTAFRTGKIKHPAIDKLLGDVQDEIARREDSQVDKQTEVQTVICSKEKFKTLDDAKAWIKAHDFKTEHKGKGPDETGSSWRFRQRDPGDFQEGSFRTIEITDGVKAVIGKPKAQKDEVLKALWGSPGGKKNVAKQLVGMLPEHDTFVEPFAGGAAVFFAKDKAGKEVLGDADAEVAFSFKFVRDVTDDQIDKLRKFDWTASKENFARVKSMKPATPLQRFFKFAYMRWASYFSRGASEKINPMREGQTCKIVDRLAKSRDRLEGVEIVHGSYDSLIKKYDSPSTVFFLDPPFPALRQGVVGETDFSEEKMLATLKGIKGKFLLTYQAESEGAFKAEDSFVVSKLRHTEPVSGREVTLLIVKNYSETTKRDVKLLPVEKADEDDDRRIVFGVVLEPNEVDTQGDTIKQDEITTAAHLWLARFQDRGLMHKEIVNGKIEIYESYLAPTNLTIGGQKVKKGTWLLMYHILDDALWKDIKSGKLTGFSMGGFGRRRPT